MTGVPDEAITAAPGSQAAAVTWTHRGQLHLTVIAKATFGFASDTEMPRLPPEPVLRADVHYQKNPARSVRFTSDLAPRLRLVDVVLTGHAQPPAPGPVQSLVVRLTVIDEGQTLLDRAIVARDPLGFERLPLVYERAYGGMGILDNPLGIGGTLDSTHPNLVDPADAKRPACFAPLGRSWPSRKQLLGKTPRKLLDAEIAQIPDDFEWDYYQSAPVEQRIARLGGGAWILLEGVCAGRRLVRMRLPDVRGLAYMHGLGPEARPLDLALDTLQIDGDEERCHVVLRGSLPIPGEGALAGVRVVAGIASAGAPVTWPSLRPLTPRSAPATPGAPSGPSTLVLDGNEQKPSGTIALAPDEQSDLAARPAVPFVSAPASGVALPPRRAPLPRQATGTLALDLDLDEGPAPSPPRAAPAAPVVAEAPPPPPATEASPPPAPEAPSPPPAPEAPSPPPPREVRAETEAPPPARAAKAPPPPPPSIPRASPALKLGLYGRFRKP